MTKHPAEIATLAPATRGWVEGVLADFQLEPHHIRLLLLAAQAWDAAQTAHAAIEQHGQTFKDRFGSPATRPEIGIERDSRLAFVRILRELALDISEPGETPRPPKIYGNASTRKG